MNQLVVRQTAACCEGDPVVCLQQMAYVLRRQVDAVWAYNNLQRVDSATASVYIRQKVSIIQSSAACQSRTWPPESAGYRNAGAMPAIYDKKFIEDKNRFSAFTEECLNGVFSM
jgi:hypothetical protein